MNQPINLTLFIDLSIDSNYRSIHQAGPPGIPVLKVTNSRSSFGKISKIPV